MCALLGCRLLKFDKNRNSFQILINTIEKTNLQICKQNAKFKISFMYVTEAHIYGYMTFTFLLWFIEKRNSKHIETSRVCAKVAQNPRD